MKSQTKWNAVIFGIGILLIVFGLSLGLCGPLLFEKTFEREVKLTPTSAAYNLWKHTPIPLYLEVYLFNWTNANEFFKDKTVKPHFEEVGPFVFREVHDRVNVTWNDNHTITYNQTRNWSFVPEASVNLSTKITNLNVVATTVSQLLKEGSVPKTIVSELFGILENLFVTSPARNWLFEGIDDHILSLLHFLRNLIHVPFNMRKFGWFYGRNMSSSYDGVFTIKTGADDLYKIGILERWNRVNKTKYFRGKCAMVNGTSGEWFPPMKSPEDNITLFISDICSSITLKQEGSSVVEGIQSYTYVGGNETFDNGQFDEGNKCFCRDECAPYGARDVKSCRMGAPLFFSFPHFYQGDESYTETVSGLTPNKNDHEFFLQLDPVTGTPTNIRAQLQINLLLKRIPWIEMFRHVPKLYVPMMWFRERATITPELAFKLKLLFIIQRSVSGVCYGVAAVGLLMILIRLFVIYRERSEKSGAELLIPGIVDNEDEDTDEKEE